MPEVLTVLSGRESTVRRLDTLRERHGDNPQDWYAALTGAAWPASEDAEGDRLWTEAAE
jgi:type IV secretion system protein VirB4